MLKNKKQKIKNKKQKIKKGSILIFQKTTPEIKN